MFGLVRLANAAQGGRVRCFSARAVLSRELLYGIRPPAPAVQSHVASLARAGRVREAIVEAYSAARAHVDVGKPTILQLMTAAAQLPARDRAELSDAVLRLSDFLLFTPGTDRTANPSAHGSTPSSAGPICAVSGPLPLVRTLTQCELEAALSALALCGHYPRVLQLAEHALHQGGAAVLSRPFLASVIEALASASAALQYPEARILDTYAGARALLSAAGVQKLDSRIACALLTLLLGGRHVSVWGATRRLASFVAVAAENSVAEAAAAVKRAGGAGDAATEGDDAHETAGQVFETVETAAAAAMTAARSLTARPEGEDPLLVAAATLLAEVPPWELVKNESSAVGAAAGASAAAPEPEPSSTVSAAAGVAASTESAGASRRSASDGGVLPFVISLCVRRGRRDRALQLLEAMGKMGARVPAAPFNQLILADAQGSHTPLAAAQGHVRHMQAAGVKPSEFSFCCFPHASAAVSCACASSCAMLAARAAEKTAFTPSPHVDTLSPIGPLPHSMLPPTSPHVSLPLSASLCLSPLVLPCRRRHRCCPAACLLCRAAAGCCGSRGYSCSCSHCCPTPCSGSQGQSTCGSCRPL